VFSKGPRAAAPLCALTLYLAGLLCSPASAEPIKWVFGQSEAVSIKQVNEAGGLLVGDKLFSDFSVVSIPPLQGTVGSAPGMEQIMLSGILSDGDYGLQFNGPWLAGPGAVVNTTIGFKAATTDDLHLIKDNTLKLTASDVSAANDPPTGLISIVENVFNGPPASGQTIAKKSVFDFGDIAASKLADSADFAPVPEVWIKKDILLLGGNGVAHLSEFTQTFSQEVIPEPGTLTLLAIGSLGLLGLVWRRRRRAETRLSNSA
jgi:hypothetical protein